MGVSFFDSRTKRSGEQCNFYIFYEVDDEEVSTVLRLEEYGVDEECEWVLLAGGCAAGGGREGDGEDVRSVGEAAAE